MYKYFICLIITIFLILCPVHRMEALSSEDLLLLETELHFAEKPKNYFVVDIHKRRIFLKVRGIVMREWEIEQTRLMCDPVTITPVVLIKKASSKSPKRVDIKPNVIQNKEEFRLEALEIQDMPTSYALVFEKGISIHVRPFLKGPSSILPRVLFLFKWYAINPVWVFFSSYKRSPFTTIDIVMKDQREAQALFWAFSERTGCILIRQPIAHPTD